MAEKVAKLGISRDKDFMLYVKDGAVWRVRRKQPGVPKGRPERVADGGFEMDNNYIYFVDRDGDVSRAKRAIGGQKRKKKTARASAKRKPAARKASKKPATRKAARKPAKKTGRQEEAQLANRSGASPPAPTSNKKSGG